MLPRRRTRGSFMSRASSRLRHDEGFGMRDTTADSRWRAAPRIADGPPFTSLDEAFAIAARRDARRAIFKKREVSHLIAAMRAPTLGGDECSPRRLGMAQPPICHTPRFAHMPLVLPSCQSF